MAIRKIKVRLLHLLMFILFGGLAFGYDFYGTSFQYRKDITIDSSLIDANLSYFPVLVKLTFSNIDFSHFLHGTNDGYDIRFTDSIDGSGDADGNILDYERERFDKSGEVAEIWVEIPSIPSSPDTTFYMFYGNTNCADGEDVNGTWDGGPDGSPANNYVGVWHLKDLTTSTVEDSTSNNNGTKGAANQPIETDAKIGKGQHYTPTAEYIQVGTTGFSASSGTVEVWGYAEGFSGPSGTYLFGHTVNPGYSQRIQLYSDDVNGNLDLGLGDSHSRHINIQDLDTYVWYYIVATWDGTNYVVYVDSINKAQGSYTGLSSIESLADIGNTGETTDRTEAWDGDLDEVRVSNIARSPAWVKASYHSGNDSLLTIPTLVELSYFRATSLDSAVLLEWATETELDNAGFNLWRSEEKDGEYVRINPYFIPAEGEAGFGAKYSFTDYDITNGVIYYYKLEDIDIYGKSTFHGPVPAIPTDLIPIWPPDRIIRPSDALFFSWNSSGNYSFKVEISLNPSFSSSDILSFPEERWTSDFSLWFTSREWETVLRKAQQSGGQLFWRLKAKTQDGKEICSGWKRLFINFNK